MAGRKHDDAGTPDTGARPKHRDNDDARDYLEGDDRAGTRPDSKSEARGDAREQLGNNARGTRAEPTGADGNDRTRARPQPDGFDADLAEDNRNSRQENS